MPTPIDASAGPALKQFVADHLARALDESLPEPSLQQIVADHRARAHGEDLKAYFAQVSALSLERAMAGSDVDAGKSVVAQITGFNSRRRR